MAVVRKTLLFIIVLTASVFSLFAIKASVYFPAKTTKKQVLPVDSSIGKTAKKSESAVNLYIATIIGKEFNYEWTEENFAPESAKALSAIYSKVLSSHLPASDFVMSKAQKNSDGSYSVAVKFKDGTVVTFVVEKSKIIGMSV